ncbi:glycosyltransferase [Candidatus Woesearchaeota archaeon]|nr:glycosyltransferase [Candidatus Woesearchaeota archaeon]
MISIIIPTKNEKHYLPKLLKSIKKQDYKDYEVIVSDAGSTDKTVKIAKKFGCKVVKGGLPSVGRNNGAKYAKGDIFLFLDSDVIIDKYFLEKSLKEFKERKLGTATWYAYPLSKRIFDKVFFFFLNYIMIIEQYFWPNAGGYCILCKKDIHKKLGGFREDLIVAEDCDYARRSAKFGKFRFLRTTSVKVSVRRLDKTGRFKLLLDYVPLGFLRVFGGVKRKNIGLYDFNYKK